MSHSIDTPTLIDRQTGRALLVFEDSRWSLDAASWLDDDRVRLILRRYPGDHDPPQLEAVVDCGAGTARVGNRAVATLSELESVLSGALHRRGPRN